MKRFERKCPCFCESHPDLILIHKVKIQNLFFCSFGCFSVVMKRFEKKFPILIYKLQIQF